MTLIKRFPAFASRDFKIFWSAQFVSNIGTQMQFVALNWQVYTLTHSAFALGLIGFLRFGPILIFSLIGGAVADAHNRKKLLFITQSIYIILSLTLAITDFTGKINVSIIYLITLFSAGTLAFDTPSRQAFVPSLVKKKHLSSAMSLNSIMFQTALIVGPSIAGVLIANTHLWVIYSINAASFLAVLTSLIFIKSTGKVEGVRGQVSLTSIAEGLSFVRTKTIIWSTMMLDFFSTFFSSATALIPIYAKDILAVGPIGLGFLYAAEAVGAVIAGILIAHKHNLKNQGMILLTSVGFYALGTIIFGFSRLFILSFLALVIVGAGDSISTILRNTIRNLETPDYIRGRMTSVNMIFFMGGPQLGDFEAGTLAGYMGAPFSVVTGGIATLFVVAMIAKKLPILRKYDRHVSQII
jgi:MFS family permease